MVRKSGGLSIYQKIVHWGVKWPEKSISKCTVRPRLSISRWDTSMEDYRNLPYNSFPSQFSLTWQVINMHQTTKYLSKSCRLLLTKAHDKQNYLLIVSQFRLHPQIPLLPCHLAMSWRRHSQGGKRVVFSARLAPDYSYAMHSCCNLVQVSEIVNWRRGEEACLCWVNILQN